ncbi:MAG: AAA family ATPase [Candidatus Omnitrophota bacterium]
MSYYKILGLEKEPFSTSPDPEFFYQSAGHRKALANVLIEIRLRRGLSVVLGDVGVGKTTLSRKLLQILRSKENIDFHMILDPSFESEHLFLLSLVKTFGIENIGPNTNTIDLKEAVESFLFRRGVGEQKTVVLLIDEAQKLNLLSLEVLRILLNYETNNFKLLQLVLLGQTELLPLLVDTPNIMDRISLKYTLGPFDKEDTIEMVEFRLRQAGYKGAEKLFAKGAFSDIYEYTRGYPRRISMLCHKALKILIMKNKPIISSDIIREIIDSEVKLGWQRKGLLLKSNY